MSEKDIVYVNIDKDILNSLYGFYFGNIQDKYFAATKRAYGDLQRTIIFPESLKNDNETTKSTKEGLIKKIFKLFETEITKIINLKDIDKKTFDKLHEEICGEIINIYKKENINLTYGHAQKWLNMTFKYLYCLQVNGLSSIFQFLHVPVDNYIIERAVKEFNIKKPKSAWSRLNKEEYKSYQEELIKAIGDKEDPLRWEFHAWLSEAKK